MKLFCMQIKGGPSHREFGKFASGVSDLSGKHPDFGGTMQGALVAHHTDADTVKLLVASNMKNIDDVAATEVTKETLQSVHFGYKALVENYYLPYDDYPNIR